MRLFAFFTVLMMAGSLSWAQGIVPNHQIDLVVVYNDTALEQIEGGVASMEAFAEEGIAQFNQLCANSEVNITVNSLGAHWVDYDQIDTPYNDQVRLRESDDGHMDDVHLLREALGADLVFMFCGDPEDPNSRSYTWTLFYTWEENNAELAFGLSRPSIVDFPFLMVRFLTTRFGCTDRVRPSGTDFPQSGSHLFQGDSGQWYRTWNASSSIAPSGEATTDLNLFSNPDLLWDGVPTGVSGEADNAGVMNLIAPDVAANRVAAGSAIHLLTDWVPVVETADASVEMEIGIFPTQAEPVIIEWQVRDWTGTAGVDTMQTSGQLNIPGGEARGTAHIDIRTDAEIEGLEEIDFVLNSSSGPEIGMDLGSIEIVDDEQRLRGTREFLLGQHGLRGNEQHYLDSNDDAQINIADYVWSSIPGHVRDVIVDNRDPGFSVPLGSRRTTNFHIGWPNGEGDYFYQMGQFDHSMAMWEPVVETGGRYEVSAWYVSAENRATNAVYMVHSVHGVDSVEVNQQENGSQWVPLGVYQFAPGLQGRVTLSNDADYNRAVIFDAIRLRCVKVLDDDDGDV